MFEVRHHDQHFLIVAKPAGQATTSPSGDACLMADLKDAFPSAPMLHPTSRLDREVSGLVTIALTSEANHHLLTARKERKYVRRYDALLSVAPATSEGEWHAAIGIDQARPKLRCAVADGEGKAALTRFSVTATLEAGPARVSLFPRTGRTHQLRVHASHAGVPILGDHHYRGPRRLTLADGRVVSCRRVMLHCASVSFPGLGPSAGAAVVVEEPPPDDFQQLWAHLQGGGCG